MDALLFLRGTENLDSWSALGLLLQGGPHVRRQLSDCGAARDGVCGVQH